MFAKTVVNYVKYLIFCYGFMLIIEKDSYLINVQVKV